MIAFIYIFGKIRRTLFGFRGIPLFSRFVFARRMSLEKSFASISIRSATQIKISRISNAPMVIESGSESTSLNSDSFAFRSFQRAIMSVISLPISRSMEVIFVELVKVVVWSVETVAFGVAA